MRKRAGWLSGLAGAVLMVWLAAPTAACGAAPGSGDGKEPGQQGQPKLAGKLVYFASGESGLVLYDLATKATTKLVLEGNPSEPALSPDGRLLAYVDGKERLHIRDLASGGEQLFAGERAEYASPVFISNTTIAYLRKVSYDTWIYLSPVDRVGERKWGGVLPREERVREITYLPGSGETLPSFVATMDSGIVVLSGSAPRVVVRRSERGDHFRYPSVSPDGSTVAFARDIPEGVWAGDLRTGAMRELDRGGSWPAYSSDGKYIAFLTTQAATRGLAIVSARSGQEIGRTGGGFLMGVSVMSADGKVAFPLADRAGKPLHTHGDRVAWR